MNTNSTFFLVQIVYLGASNLVLEYGSRVNMDFACLLRFAFSSIIRGMYNTISLAGKKYSTSNNRINR